MSNIDKNNVSTEQNSMNTLARQVTALVSAKGVEIDRWDWCTTEYPHLPGEISRKPEDKQTYEKFVKSLGPSQIIHNRTLDILPKDCHLPEAVANEIFKGLHSPVYFAVPMYSLAPNIGPPLPLFENLAPSILGNNGFTKLEELTKQAMNNYQNHWDQLYLQFFLETLISFACLKEESRSLNIVNIIERKIFLWSNENFRKWRPIDNYLSMWFFYGALSAAGFNDQANWLWNGGKENATPSWLNFLPELKNRVNEVKALAESKIKERAEEISKVLNPLLKTVTKIECLGDTDFIIREFTCKGKTFLLPDNLMLDYKRIDIDALHRIARDSDAHVIIRGETGTGKESLANYIMENDERLRGKRESINCALLLNERAESELFGHLEGAYTGALGKRTGILAKCKDGIVFLDEVGRLPSNVQAMLLRFLSENEIRPMGSDDTYISKVRVIAGMNNEPDSNIAHDFSRRFTMSLQMPSLKLRKQDIFWFLAQQSFGLLPEYKFISLRGLCLLLLQNWEGNIKELKNECARLIKLYPISTNHAEPILDFNELKGENSHRWEQFALTSIYLIEVATKGKVQSIPPCGLNICKLLIELFYCPEERPEIAKIPIALLPSLAGPGGTRFSIGWIKSILGNGLVPSQQALDDASTVSFASALLYILNCATCFEEHMRENNIGNISAEKTTEFILPSDQFTVQLIQKTYAIKLWPNSFIKSPQKNETLKDILDRLNITGQKRLICELSADGWSNAKIAKHSDVTCRRTSVHDILTNLRNTYPNDLAPLISPKQAGRKKNAGAS